MARPRQGTSTLGVGVVGSGGGSQTTWGWSQPTDLPEDAPSGQCGELSEKGSQAAWREQEGKQQPAAQRTGRAQPGCLLLALRPRAPAQHPLSLLQPGSGPQGRLLDKGLGRAERPP